MTLTRRFGLRCKNDFVVNRFGRTSEFRASVWPSATMCVSLRAVIEKGAAMSLRLCTQKSCPARILTTLLVAVFLLLIIAAQPLVAQQPLGDKPFTNYFVTGDYVVGGWVEQSSNGVLATGTISIPDSQKQPNAGSIPVGADIVAAYLYWGTVEGSQTLFVGQQAVFNGYKIVGKVLGNPNAPTSWSSGGCTGSSTGSKTMRMYRADVRPYLPLDTNSASPTFGALLANGLNGSIPVQIADSGSNGNTQPNALGATLVIIYRQLSPALPLNAIVLYDGSYAPSNSNPTMNQTLIGFDEPDATHAAKITHIVANGQMNKGETVKFDGNKLDSLYGSAPPFPGIYGAWDNPTWDVTQYVHGGLVGSNFDTQEATSVSPSSTNSGCVNWGAMIFSTTVQDSDADGLLDIWEHNHSYTDAASGSQIALPGADQGKKDLFVQVDYLTLRDPNNSNPLTNVLHSHLPKQQALDTVGLAFFNQHINVHFDLPQGIYTGDPYVISTGANQPGVGGNEISESSLLCNAANCAFPGQPAVSWKGGVEALQNTQNPKAPAGNLYFQTGRGQSYRYVLFGHSMGEPRFYWNTLANQLATADAPELGGSAPQLVSIVNQGTSATVTIKSPTLINGTTPPQFLPLVVKPGDCTTMVPPPQACGDANNGTVTISGSLTPAPGFNHLTAPSTLTFPLNGTYTFTFLSSSGPDNNGVITTQFTIPTSGATDGTYQFNCSQLVANPPCIAEPQLGVSYLGPTTSSGHADFGGGGDVEVTLGLWGADDVAGCQTDPSQPAGAQGFCNNQVGTLKTQTGTLMHELGHTLTLTHGGTYYQAGLPTYDINCKPNFLSVMNYLFQVRGFPDVPDGGFNYSGQTLPSLNETAAAQNGVPRLSETTGLGVDPATGNAQHLSRWYSKPNADDSAIGNFALAHCEGSPLLQGEPNSVRVEGTLAPGGTFSAPVDWNNDLTAGNDPILGQDLNHNGSFADTPFLGFNDWDNINPAAPGDSTAFQQINARSTGFGFSEGGGLIRSPGSGLIRSPGSGVDGEGSGLIRSPGSGLIRSPGSGLIRSPGSGEQNTETANSVADPPTNLSCTTPLLLNGVTVAGCSPSTGGTFMAKAKAVPLTWKAPDFGQIRSYVIWRAIGNFQTPQQVFANFTKFSQIGSISNPNGAAGTSFVDTFQLKSGTTYTYFVTDQNTFQAKSAPSKTLVVKF